MDFVVHQAQPSYFQQQQNQHQGSNNQDYNYAQVQQPSFSGTGFYQGGGSGSGGGASGGGGGVGPRNRSGSRSNSPTSSRSSSASPPTSPTYPGAPPPPPLSSQRVRHSTTSLSVSHICEYWFSSVGPPIASFISVQRFYLAKTFKSKFNSPFLHTNPFHSIRRSFFKNWTNKAMAAPRRHSSTTYTSLPTKRSPLGLTSPALPGSPSWTTSPRSQYSPRSSNEKGDRRRRGQGGGGGGGGSGLLRQLIPDPDHPRSAIRVGALMVMVLFTVIILWMALFGKSDQDQADVIPSRQGLDFESSSSSDTLQNPVNGWSKWKYIGWGGSKEEVQKHDHQHQQQQDLERPSSSNAHASSGSSSKSASNSNGENDVKGSGDNIHDVHYDQDDDDDEKSQSNSIGAQNSIGTFSKSLTSQVSEMEANGSLASMQYTWHESLNLTALGFNAMVAGDQAMKANSVKKPQLQQQAGQVGSNRSGRLIVVGDLHGQHTSLKTLLNRLAYSAETDTLLHTGDLLSKAPLNYSLETVKWMRLNRVKGVRGNHDQGVLEWRNWMREMGSLDLTLSPISTSSSSSSSSSILNSPSSKGHSVGDKVAGNPPVEDKPWRGYEVKGPKTRPSIDEDGNEDETIAQFGKFKGGSKKGKGNNQRLNRRSHNNNDNDDGVDIEKRWLPFGLGSDSSSKPATEDQLEVEAEMEEEEELFREAVASLSDPEDSDTKPLSSAGQPAAPSSPLNDDSSGTSKGSIENIHKPSSSSSSTFSSHKDAFHGVDHTQLSNAGAFVGHSWDWLELPLETVTKELGVVIPEGWEWGGQWFEIARHLSTEDVDYLEQRPLTMYLEGMKTFLVHAGMLPWSSSTPSLTSVASTTVVAAAVRSTSNSSFEPTSTDLKALQNDPARSILLLPENLEPYTLLNVRALKGQSKKTGEWTVTKGKKGTPWSDIWNAKMKSCENDSKGKGNRKGKHCQSLSVIYGHWAGAGLDIKSNSVGLDSGCVYGKRLSALVLDLNNSTVAKVSPLSQVRDKAVVLGSAAYRVLHNNEKQPKPKLPAGWAKGDFKLPVQEGEKKVKNKKPLFIGKGDMQKRQRIPMYDRPPPSNKGASDGESDDLGEYDSSSKAYKSKPGTAKEVDNPQQKVPGWKQVPKKPSSTSEKEAKDETEVVNSYEQKADSQVVDETESMFQEEQITFAGRDDAWIVSVDCGMD